MDKPLITATLVCPNKHKTEVEVFRIEDWFDFRLKGSDVREPVADICHVCEERYEQGQQTYLFARIASALIEAGKNMENRIKENDQLQEENDYIWKGFQKATIKSEYLEGVNERLKDIIYEMMRADAEFNADALIQSAEEAKEE